jgi:hypothetical protein
LGKSRNKILAGAIERGERKQTVDVVSKTGILIFLSMPHRVALPRKNLGEWTDEADSEKRSAVGAVKKIILRDDDRGDGGGGDGGGAALFPEPALLAYFPLAPFALLLAQG